MNFGTHHQIVKNSSRPPSQALLEGLKVIKVPSIAIDLGCGAGADTDHLLKNGWRVFAVDADQDILDVLSKNHSSSPLKTSCQRFESLELPKAHLINACFSLPFCQPSMFADCWGNICNSIPKGGVFSGQFFGVHDSWSSRRNMTFHTAKDVEQLFKDFEPIWQLEVERDGKALGGEIKHWHVFHIAARKL